MAIYKVGENIKLEYDNAPVFWRKQWPIGAYIDIFNKEKTKKIARVEVTESNSERFFGKVINTFGHKRR